MQEQVKAAIFGNIYFSDNNSIDTLDQLTYRLDNSYEDMYLPYLAKVTDEPEGWAEYLDSIVRIQLTIFGVLYCICCNQLERLYRDYISKIYYMADRDSYKGCIVAMDNGVVIDTFSRRAYLELADLSVGIPPHIAMELDVCVGHPYFRGEDPILKQDIEVVTMDDDEDVDYSDLSENFHYDISEFVKLAAMEKAAKASK